MKLSTTFLIATLAAIIQAAPIEDTVSSTSHGCTDEPVEKHLQLSNFKEPAFQSTLLGNGFVQSLNAYLVRFVYGDSYAVEKRNLEPLIEELEAEKAKIIQEVEGLLGKSKRNLEPLIEELEAKKAKIIQEVEGLF
ncbi:uncharacterized protein LODBEIA_P15010 [Lodderomyces beijingensis]|uniref:Uncharacterized protein n=1 Tax=Lodderomyces beijingensis TaxID=1775926 RepID=A0ABP0ZM52_9ASCO